MQYPEDTLATGGLSLLAAATLQDHLRAAGNDLERLQQLLASACGALLHSFDDASASLRGLRQTLPAAAPALDATLEQLGQALMALQFEDMAGQLIRHTGRCLRSCIDELAQQTFADDDDGPAWVEDAPLRPNPVTQERMDAGTVELF